MTTYYIGTHERIDHELTSCLEIYRTDSHCRALSDSSSGGYNHSE